MSAIQHELDEDSYLARRLGLGPEPPSNPGSQDLAGFDVGSNKAGGSLEGITSRKAPLRGPLDGGGPADPSYDVDDNKYEKHSIGQLWKNLSTYASSPHRTRTHGAHHTRYRTQHACATPRTDHAHTTGRRQRR